MAALAETRVLAALELRFDYHSARATLNNVKFDLGWTSDEGYSPEMLEVLCTELQRRFGEQRVATVVKRIESWLGQPIALNDDEEEAVRLAAQQEAARVKASAEADRLSAEEEAAAEVALKNATEEAARLAAELAAELALQRAAEEAAALEEARLKAEKEAAKAAALKEAARIKAEEAARRLLEEEAATQKKAAVVVEAAPVVEPKAKVVMVPPSELELAAPPARHSPAEGLRLVLRGVEVAPDQIIVICGNHALLGNWDLAGALHCERAEDGSWQAQIDGLEPGVEFEFKFVKLSAGGQAKWEQAENHHARVPAAGVDALIEAKWRS